MIGAKYYEHNNEIPLDNDHVVMVFDQNDTSLGTMKLSTAKELAAQQKMDVVLRSKTQTPPLVKIMEYRKDLMRKILTRLGNRQEDDGEGKTKALQLSSNISTMDLENKKKQAIQILKKASVLKIYLRLSKLDQTSLSKGKIILNSFATDLSQYASVRVKPGFQGKSVEITKEKEEEEKKEIDMEEQDRIIEEAEMKADMHEGKKEKSDQQTMLYMELKSNVAQSSLDVDIETMLQSSSLEDFMDQLLKGKLEQKEQADRSKIKDEEKEKEGIFNPAQQSEALRREAMLNLKKKRIELK